MDLMMIVWLWGEIVVSRSGGNYWQRREGQLRYRLRGTLEGSRDNTIYLHRRDASDDDGHRGGPPKPGADGYSYMADDSISDDLDFD